LVAGALLLASCGGGDSTDASKGATGAKVASSAKKAWADRVFDIYETTVKDTVAALEKTPPTAEALPKLKAIRDKAIEALVPLGREREAMDAATKKQAESQMLMKLMAAERSDAFKAYMALVNGTYSFAKMKTDDEKALYKILSGVNIITQYAHFELLKKQAPKEAERLGIK